MDRRLWAEAHAKRESGDVHSAIRCYQACLDLEPTLSGAHTNLGEIYGQMGNDKMAARCFRKSLEIQPRCALSHCNLGGALSNLGEHEAALPCFEACLELDPNNPLALANRGFTLHRMNRLEDALASHQRCLEVSGQEMDESKRGDAMSAVLLQEVLKAVDSIKITMEHMNRLEAGWEPPDGDEISSRLSETLTWDKAYDRCGTCGERPNKKLLLCSRCLLIGYCSHACQKAAWKAHKKSCGRPIPSPVDVQSSSHECLLETLKTYGPAHVRLPPSNARLATCTLSLAMTISYHGRLGLRSTASLLSIPCLKRRPRGRTMSTLRKRPRLMRP